MRVMIDTNILISSILGHGTPFQAYVKAVSYPNQGVICSQIVDEMRRIFNRKFPKKIPAMERFLTMALQTLELVQIPETKFEQESSIRDVKDRTILRAAIAAHVDIILTGDKDFLESSVSDPRIISVPDFLSL